MHLCIFDAAVQRRSHRILPGARVYHKEPGGNLQPTIILGVPVLIETLYKKIWKNVRAQGKEKLLTRLLAMNRKTKKIGLDISKPFTKEILAVFGGRMRVIISGGAAIDPAILQFFNDIGIIAVQGYGLTVFPDGGTESGCAKGYEKCFCRTSASWHGSKGCGQGRKTASVRSASKAATS